MDHHAIRTHKTRILQSLKIIRKVSFYLYKTGQNEQNYNSRWTKLVKMDKVGQSWTKWTKLVKMDKVGQNGQELIQMDKVGQNGQSWTKWTKLDKMEDKGG